MKGVDSLLDAVIISNESLVVDLFKRMIKSTGKINIIGCLEDDKQAVSKVEQINPGIVFIKLEEPVSTGLKIATQLKAKSPELEIVFLSKHEQYAVDAFNIPAIDYILIPFDQERIHKMVHRLSNNKKLSSSEDTYTVCCFKNLHFKRNGEEIKEVKWRTAKAKELFALLIQNRKETMIRKDVLVEMLWPEQDTEKAYEQLYCTIYQIRQTLKSVGINIKIVSSANGYELLFNGVTCDVDEWEEGIKSIPEITDETLPFAKKLIKKYVGDYLTEETYPWRENEQERLRVIYQSFSNGVLNYLYGTEKYTEASLLALRNQRHYPYLQDSYFMLMRIYDKYEDIYNSLHFLIFI